MVVMRQKMSREFVANQSIPGVRVKPSNEANRVNIRHPSGIAFRATTDDSVEWPNDAFTKRRIRDGSVLKAEARAVVAPVLEAPKRKKFGAETV
jgi:hypothetical protein